MKEVKLMEISTQDNTIVGKKVGTITIDVYKSPVCKSAFYYIKPDQAKLLPVVDVLDDVLTSNSIEI